MQKFSNQGLGDFRSPERFALMQGLLISLRLSFPESREDMPFSFPAPGIITGSGNGSVGHLGLLHAKRREINVNTLKKAAQRQCQEAMPLILGNHQVLDGISSKNSISELRLGTLSSFWEDSCSTEDNKHVSREGVILRVFLAK